MSGETFLEKHKDELNQRQLEAVVTTEGPVLVLAGAGSGKTRVLTYRIAHLVYDYETPLHQILAMTFSNKAAREMHDRVKMLLGVNNEIRFPWISTFHSVCARLLRANGGRLGLKSDYAIYDESDQLSMMKGCFDRLNISDKAIAPEAALKRIGEWKNQGKFSEDALEVAATGLDENCAKLYKAYEASLREAQAVDFDDLLLLAYRLFRDHADLKAQFQENWKYILIDEFQDTNDIQYKLVKEILNPQRNICVVGDDDQSIYGWRGAKIENILQFDQAFQGARVIKLEQNYRSTGNILKAAASIISKNEMRHEKTLWTQAGEGQRIRIMALNDDRDEAFYVIRECKELIKQGMSPNEIAIFYRVNSLSRGFEEECLKQRILYKIVGGFRFYERKEIKDILSYLKLLMNPADIMAFKRAVNTPARGVGATSMEKIEAFAIEAKVPVGLWLANVEQIPISGKAKEGLKQFKEILIWGLDSLDSTESLVDLFMDVIQRSQIVKALESQKSEENQERIENIQELMSAVQEFEETWKPQEPAPAKISARHKLRDFLERVSLMADIDSLDNKDLDQITLMSFHAAKGLEFKACFMAGMEEGLFPSARSFDDYQRTEEERRLCYVGITRARQKLYLTRAQRRRTFGSINFNLPSRFLADLPKAVLETVVDQASDNYDYDVGDTTFWRPGRRGGSSAAAKPAATIDPDYGFDFDQQVQEFSFKRGERVSHPSFGDGVVQKCEMLGDEECLSISFRARGLKKVLAKFVKKSG